MPSNLCLPSLLILPSVLFNPAFRACQSLPFMVSNPACRPLQPCLSCLPTLPFVPVNVAFHCLQEAARRAHERLAAEENLELIMAKAQRQHEEEQYAKDVTRMEQQTEVQSMALLL